MQCLHRWNKILKPGLVKGPWTIEEDRKLLEWVKINGPTKWTSCSDFISGRSGKQCRERWYNTLNPNVKKGGWTPEEDFLIFKFFSEFGSKWSLIASKFPGRTENSVKNRFYSTLRRISLDKKKILFNEKKNVNIIKSKLSNNAINNEYNPNELDNINNNDNSNCLSNPVLNNDCLNMNNPSSNLEELMKYLPQAFAEKTQIYLQYKKNEGQLVENLNLNIENFQDLEKLDLNSLIKNSNLENLINEKKQEDSKIKCKNSSKDKYSKIVSSKDNLNNYSTLDTKNNSLYKLASISNFLQTQEKYDDSENACNELNNNFANELADKNINLSLLNKKRARGSKHENINLPNQINNTYNFNININSNRISKQSLFDNKKSINENKESKENNINNDNNDIKFDFKKKPKFETKKYPKIDELEKLIQNFHETNSKLNSCEASEDGELPNKIKKINNKIIKKAKKTSVVKSTKQKKCNLDNYSKTSNFSDSEKHILESSGFSTNNSACDKSNESKDFLFKVPEVCSNEEVKKLSLNLMQGANYDSTSTSKFDKNDFENYLYLENKKTNKNNKKSNQSEKEEIFKFDALNNLYDQLNNLENILLNTKKQLFSLDKLYYKETSLESNSYSKSSYKNINNLPVTKKLENLSSNLNRLNEGINVIANLQGNENAEKAYLETLTFTENKELNKNEIIENEINQESRLSLQRMDKNPLFMQDDLHDMNLNDMNNIRIGNFISNQNNINNVSNLFNTNLLFNNYNGHIQEEQEFPFMDNMFQI